MVIKFQCKFWKGHSNRSTHIMTFSASSGPVFPWEVVSVLSDLFHLFILYEDSFIYNIFRVLYILIFMENVLIILQNL